MAEGSSADDEPRHGFLVGEVRLLIPRAIRSQYLPSATVFPVPRATRRLRGLVHWRGQAVVAIDADDPPSVELPVIGTCNLLLFGPDDDAIALVQRAPPRVVHLADAALDAGPSSQNKPLCWLSDALLEPRVDDSQQVWWELNLSEIAQRMHSAQITEDPDLEPESANPND